MIGGTSAGADELSKRVKGLDFDTQGLLARLEIEIARKTRWTSALSEQMERGQDSFELDFGRKMLVRANTVLDGMNPFIQSVVEEVNERAHQKKALRPVVNLLRYGQQKKLVESLEKSIAGLREINGTMETMGMVSMRDQENHYHGVQGLKCDAASSPVLDVTPASPHADADSHAQRGIRGLPPAYSLPDTVTEVKQALRSFREGNGTERTRQLGDLAAVPETPTEEDGRSTIGLAADGFRALQKQSLLKSTTTGLSRADQLGLGVTTVGAGGCIGAASTYMSWRSTLAAEGSKEASEGSKLAAEGTLKLAEEKHELEVAKLVGEVEKIECEKRRLMAEARKTEAEAAKLEAETALLRARACGVGHDGGTGGSSLGASAYSTPADAEAKVTGTSRGDDSEQSVFATPKHQPAFASEGFKQTLAAQPSCPSDPEAIKHEATMPNVSQEGEVEATQDLPTAELATGQVNYLPSDAGINNSRAGDLDGEVLYAATPSTALDSEIGSQVPSDAILTSVTSPLTLLNGPDDEDWETESFYSAVAQLDDDDDASHTEPFVARANTAFDPVLTDLTNYNDTARHDVAARGESDGTASAAELERRKVLLLSLLGEDRGCSVFSPRE